MGLASTNVRTIATIMAERTAAIANTGCVAAKSAGEVAPRGETLKREANTAIRAVRMTTTTSNTVRCHVGSVADCAEGVGVVMLVCVADVFVKSVAFCIDVSIADLILFLIAYFEQSVVREHHARRCFRGQVVDIPPPLLSPSEFDLTMPQKICARQTKSKLIHKVN